MRTRNLNFSTILFSFLIVFTMSCGEKNPEELTFTDKELGQLLVVGFRGTEIDSESLIVHDIKNYNIGGVILYNYDFELEKSGRNISDPDQLLQLNSALVGYSLNPPIISVENDGSTQSPLIDLYPEWNNIFQDRQLSDTNKVKEYARNFAQEFMVVGINSNFHPRLDLKTSRNNVSASNLISEDAVRTTDIANLILDEYDKEKLLSVPKYFPGYSSDYNPIDTTDDITESWSEEFIIPYKNLIESRTIRGIQTSHSTNTNIDVDWPGSLSNKTVSGLLRDSLGFEGVVFSDDLQKPIITTNFDLETTIQQSINAGVDVLVFGNNHQYDPKIVSKVIQIIQKLLKEGKIEPETIQQSLERIDKLKQDVIAELCTCLTT